MLRIGVLASHEGATFQSIINACAQGRIDCRVARVISNNSESGAFRSAAAAGGFHAVRVNDQYRIVFRFEGGDAFDVQCTDYH